MKIFDCGTKVRRMRMRKCDEDDIDANAPR